MDKFVLYIIRHLNCRILHTLFNTKKVTPKTSEEALRLTEPFLRVIPCLLRIKNKTYIPRFQKLVCFLTLKK